MKFYVNKQPESNNQHLNIFLFDCFYMYTQRISHSYGSGSVEYSAKKSLV